MSIELQICEQQIKLLKDRPQELEKLNDLVRVALAKSNRRGLSSRKYNQKIAEKNELLKTIKIFK